MARPPPSQLPSILLRPEHLADRHLDDAHRHQLAGLSPHRFGHCFWASSSFAGQIPVFLAGSVCRRLGRSLDRHMIWWSTQTLSMVQSFALAVLTLAQSSPFRSHRSQPCSRPDQRLRHAVTPILHRPDGRRREDLGNAIALNSSMVNIARLIGPSLAGVVIALRRRRLLLPDRWHQLPGGDRLAADDACNASEEKDPRAPICDQLKRRLALRVGSVPSAPSFCCSR